MNDPHQTGNQVLAEVHGLRERLAALERAEVQRRQAEETLRQRLHLLQAATEGNEDAVFVKDREGRYLMINAAGARLIGRTVEEVLGQDDHRLFAPEAARQIVEDDRRVMATGEKQTFEQTATAAGITRHYLTTKAPYRDPRGHTVGVIGIARDITERHQAEVALRQSEERFRLVLDNSRDGIYQLNLQRGTYDYVSPSVEQITGYSAEELIAGGLSLVTALTHPDDLERLREHVGRLVAHTVEENMDPTIEYRFRTKHRGYRWISDTREVIFDHGHAPTAIIGNIRDVTERKQAEEERARLIREQAAREQAEVARQRLAFLAEASTRLAASLDCETTLTTVARLAVPCFADYCTVDLLGEDQAPRQVAVAHANPALEESLRELRQRYPFDPDLPYGVPRVLRTGRSEVASTVDDAWKAAAVRDGEHLRRVRALGFQSSMIVPLVARGRTLGAISFLAAESGQHYGPEDLTLAEELARRAALAVENARLYQDARRAEQRYRDLVQGLDAIVAEADARTWQVTFVSRRAEALLGYPVGRWLQEPDFWVHLLHPQDRERVVARCREATAQGRDHELDYRVVAADGRVVWLRDQVRLVRDALGEVRQLRCLMTDITAYRHAEDALRENEERFRQAVNAFPHAFVIYDADRRFQFVNTRAIQLSGHSEQAYLGHRDEDLFPTEITDTYLPSLRRVVETRTPQSVESTLALPGGRFTLAVSFVPLLDPRGEIYQILGFTHDLTARKRAEEALRESEEKFRAQYRGIPIPTYTWQRSGEDFVLIDSNAAGEAATEGRITDMVGRTAQSLYPDMPEILEGLSRCLREKVVVKQELAYRLRSTGESRDVAATHVFVPPDLVMVHAEDVTERKRSEQALGESRRRLQALFDNALDAYLLADDEARFVDANPAACALLGYRREELLRLHLWDITPAQGRDLAPQRWREFLAQGKLAGEFTVLRKDGTTRDVEFRSAAHILPGLHLSASRDITERKRAEGLSAVQTQVLEEIATAAPLPRVLEVLIRSIERHSTDMLGSILLLDKDGTHLRHGAAPSLPGEYTRAIDGAAIGPQVGSCGTAAYLGRPVVVSDIATDPLWADYRHLALAHGLRACWSAPIRSRDGGVLGTFAMYYRHPRSPGADELRLIDVSTYLASVAIERNQADEALQEQAQRLQGLSQRLLEVQEQERRHLARELHDEIGQTLTGLSLALQPPDDLPVEAARSRLGQARALVAGLVALVRALSLDLRPAMLDDLGLLPTLLWHFQRFTVQTGVRVTFTHSGLEGRFAPGVETAAYRIAQEALTNAARHAHVRDVTVVLWADRHRLTIQIEDRGDGFEVGQAAKAGTSGGLAGMRERAQLLGGELRVESVPGSGTCLTAELPLGCQSESRPAASWAGTPAPASSATLPPP